MEKKEYRVRKPIGVYDLSNNFKGFLMEQVVSRSEYNRLSMKFLRNQYNPLEVVINKEKVVIKHYF